ncbi:microtubule-associated protein futsch-like isoform X9 [Teleopsis dalmanni]|uniref:microtubule-associated protein futsch-like isoform X9 n=1 Tax=Teleopsis dalmanni TaxID=139649 RepID=UPI0018CD21F4|nr:microtubule-associated protein futsch-like isoform X9 [Teleopsis dalmanni]
MECSSCRNQKISPISPPFGGFLCTNGHMNCVTCADVSPGVCPICHALEKFVELRFTTENITTEPTPDIDFEYIPNVTKAPIELLNRKRAPELQIDVIPIKKSNYTSKVPNSTSMIKSISDYDVRNRKQNFDFGALNKSKLITSSPPNISKQRDALRSKREQERRAITYRKPILLTPASSVVTVCHKEDYLNVSRARMAARRVKEQRGIQFLKERCEKRGIPYDFKLTAEKREIKPLGLETKKTEDQSKNVLNAVNRSSSSKNLIQKAGILNKILEESNKKLQAKDFVNDNKKLSETRHTGGTSEDLSYERYVAETIARFPRLIKPIIPGSHQRKTSENLKKARDMVNKMVDKMIAKNKSIETDENSEPKSETEEILTISTEAAEMEKNKKQDTSSMIIKKQSKEIQKKLESISESIRDSFDNPIEVTKTELDKSSKNETEKKTHESKDVEYRPVSEKDENLNIFHVENKNALDLTTKYDQDVINTTLNETKDDLSTNSSTKTEDDLKKGKKKKPKEKQSDLRHVGGGVESSSSTQDLSDDNTESSATTVIDRNNPEVPNEQNCSKKSKETEETESKSKIPKKSRSTSKASKVNSSKEVIESDTGKTRKTKTTDSKSSKMQGERKGLNADKLQVSKAEHTKSTTQKRKPKIIKEEDNLKLGSKATGIKSKGVKSKKDDIVGKRSVIKKSEVYEKLMGAVLRKTGIETSDEKIESPAKPRKTRAKGGQSKDVDGIKKKDKSPSKLNSSKKGSILKKADSESAPTDKIGNYEEDFEQNLEKAKKKAYISILKPEPDPISKRKRVAKKVSFLNKDTVYHLKAKTKTVRVSKAAKVTELPKVKSKIKPLVSKKQSKTSLRHTGGSTASDESSLSDTTEESTNNRNLYQYTILKETDGSKCILQAIRDPATTEPRRSKSKQETTEDSKKSTRLKSKTKTKKGDSDDKRGTSVKSKTEEEAPNRKVKGSKLKAKKTKDESDTPKTKSIQKRIKLKSDEQPSGSTTSKTEEEASNRKVKGSKVKAKKTKDESDTPKTKSIQKRIKLKSDEQPSGSTMEKGEKKEKSPAVKRKLSKLKTKTEMTEDNEPQTKKQSLKNKSVTQKTSKAVESNKTEKEKKEQRLYKKKESTANTAKPTNKE